MKIQSILLRLLVIAVVFGLRVANADDDYAIIEARPSVIIELLNTQCPIKISGQLTIQQVFSLTSTSDGFAVDCITTISTGKKVQRLRFVVAAGRLLIDQTEVVDLSKLSVNIGTETKTFAANIFPTTTSFKIAIAPSSLPSLDLSKIPKLLTRSEDQAPSGCAMRSHPVFVAK